MRRTCSRIAALLIVAGAAQAQPYPSKPVRLIVPFAPGGGLDVIARLLAQKMGDALGQQTVIDNRPGAGASIGIEAGLRADPDGYTLTMITPSYAINPSLYPVRFNPLADYTPVILAAKGPLLVVVHPSLPARTMRDLIALAKARPGQLPFGTAGQGTIVHLATELFLDMAKVKMIHIPYKGGAPALTDLIAGQVSLVFSPMQISLAQAKAGRVRALAVTTAERVAAEPDIPTIAESGVPGYEATNWFGMIGPKGVPRPVVERLNRELVKAVRLKDVEERMYADGISPLGGPPEDLHAQIAREIPQWRAVIERAKVRVE
jgi:tripartite-type tricarboxylate transporter receptor subunit TctC